MPSIATRKSLTTYSRRRARPQQASEISSSSSPAVDGAQKEDITLAEMSRRIAKRSRQAAQSTTERPTDSYKKLKQRHEGPTIANQSSPEVPLSQQNYQIPLDRDDRSQFETPLRSLKSSISMIPSSTKPYNQPEQFSPVPRTRRAISRSRSRNFKENSTRPFRSNGLASPFNSRPSSAASSPTNRSRSSKVGNKLKARQTPYQAKSRTLSSAFTQAPNTDSIFSTVDTTLPSRTVSRAPSPVKDKSSLHKRFPSQPSNTTSMQEFCEQDWLIPSQGVFKSTAPFFLDMSPPGYDEGLMFSDLLSSFPVAASTPARPRRPLANKTPDYNIGTDREQFRSPAMHFVNQISPSFKTPNSPHLPTIPIFGDATEGTQCTEDVVMADASGLAHAQSRPKTRPRKHTMIRVPSDSIFSSSLDFSASVNRSSLAFQDGMNSRTMTHSGSKSADFDLAGTSKAASASSMDLTSIIGTSHTHGVRRASESSMDLISIFVSPTTTVSAPLQLGVFVPGAQPAIPALLPAFVTPTGSPSHDMSSSPIPFNAIAEDGDVMMLTTGHSPALEASRKSSPVLPGPSTMASPGLFNGADNDQLGDLFSVLGLDETDKQVIDMAIDPVVRSSAAKPQSYQVVDSAGNEEGKDQGKRRNRAGTIRASDYAWNASKESEKGKGRMRAGTIRASDYGQGNPMPSASRLPVPSHGRPRGRSRSGTVSAAPPVHNKSASAQPIVLSRPTASISKIPVGRPTQSSVGGDGQALPTMKVKNHKEPLSPQKPGELDDELLLVSRGWGWPHWERDSS